MPVASCLELAVQPFENGSRVLLVGTNTCAVPFSVRTVRPGDPDDAGDTLVTVNQTFAPGAMVSLLLPGSLTGDWKIDATLGGTFTSLTLSLRDPDCG